MKHFSIIAVIIILIILIVGLFSMNKFTNKTIAQKVNYITKTPEVIRSEGNHLKNQKSVYLSQHAYNPVDWYPWNEEAVERAKKEDKPIFLSIGYSSCHWCHYALVV